MGNSCGLVKKGQAMQHIVIPLQRPRDAGSQPDFLMAQIGPFFKHQELSSHPKNDEEAPFESFASKKFVTFKRRLRKGPPVQYRWNAWMAQLGVSTKINEENYKAVPKPSKEIRAVIKKDLDRTFPEEPYFDKTKFGNIGQRALYNVLYKFAQVKPQVGYCQSLNFVAAFLLLVSGGSEVEVFYFLLALCDRFTLEGVYSEGMPYLETLLTVFNKVFQNQMPDLYAHFQEELVPDHLWIGKWIMTLCIDAFPMSVTVRIWDCLIIEGLTFVMKVGMAILKILKELFLEISGEQIWKELKDLKNGYGFGHLCPSPELLIPEASKVKLTQQKFKTLVMKHTKEEVPTCEPELETPPKLKRPRTSRFSYDSNTPHQTSLRSTQDTVQVQLPSLSRWSLNPDGLTTSIKRCISVSELGSKISSRRSTKSKVPKLPDIKGYRGSSVPSEDESDLNDRDDTVLQYTHNSTKSARKSLAIENRRPTTLFSTSFVLLPEKKPPLINQHIGFINNRLPM